MVGVIVAAEGVPRVQAAVRGEIQVILFHELRQISRAHVLPLGTKGVLQIKAVDAQLVRHDHIAVVRHTAGDPVVAADGLQPPDLVHVLEGDAVHLVGTIRFQQLAQPPHALAGRVDIRQGQVDDIFLPDAAGHQRVRAQHAGVGGDGLGGGHAHIGRVDAAGRPDALALHRIGHGGEAQRTFGQRHLHMRKHTAVGFRHLRRVHHGEFFGGEVARAGIVVAGDHGGAIIRSIFADQNCRTSHNLCPPFRFVLIYYGYCSLF